MRVSFVHICDWPVLAPGVPSLVTVVRQAGHEVQAIDLTFTPRNRRAVVMSALTAFRPRVICFSVYDTLARQICQEARAALPEASVIFGGHQATLFPDELLADPNVDGACLGDGEEALVELLERLQRGPLTDAVPGFAIRIGSEVRHGPLRPPADPARLPSTDWSLWDIPRYLERSPVARGTMCVSASRGCLHACSFCGRHGLRRANPGRRYLLRPPTLMVEELLRLFSAYGDRGLRFISFVDHVFGANARWLAEFTRLYREAGLAARLPWACQARVEQISEEWCASVHGAGCRLVEFGVETVDDERRYELMKKPIRRERFVRAAALLRQAGIGFNVFLLAGVPGWTSGELLRSVVFAERLGARVVYLSRYVPLRKTELGDRCWAAGQVEPVGEHDVRVRFDRMGELGLQTILWWQRLRRLHRLVRLGIEERGLRFLSQLGVDSSQLVAGIGLFHPLALVSTLDRQINEGALAST